MVPKRQSSEHARRRVAAARRKSEARWSRRVTAESDELDLEPGVFAKNDPHAIAKSLQRSAAASTRRKSSPFQSAMSMLTVYINRAGRSLSGQRRTILDRAKLELRRRFGK